MLVDEQDVMLEAGVEMCFESKFANHRIVMAIDVSIDSVHALKYLSDHAGK